MSSTGHSPQPSLPVLGISLHYPPVLSLGAPFSSLSSDGWFPSLLSIHPIRVWSKPSGLEACLIPSDKISLHPQWIYKGKSHFLHGQVLRRQVLSNNRHWSEELLPTASLLFPMNFKNSKWIYFQGLGLLESSPLKSWQLFTQPADRQLLRFLTGTNSEYWSWEETVKRGVCDAFLFFRKQKTGYCFTRRRMGSHGLRPLPVPSASCLATIPIRFRHLAVCEKCWESCKISFFHWISVLK